MKNSVLVVLAPFTFLAAQTQPTPAAPAASPAAPVETTSRTKHEMTVNGAKIPYTAAAGTLILKKDDGKPSASIFYVAYTRDDSPDPSKRPLTFCFNGGPGSSSVWLHLGALGPKRVEMDPNGDPPAPPYRLIDNPDRRPRFRRPLRLHRPP